MWVKRIIDKDNGQLLPFKSGICYIRQIRI